jgi:hypothetical protein
VAPPGCLYVREEQIAICSTRPSREPRGHDDAPNRVDREQTQGLARDLRGQTQLGSKLLPADTTLPADLAEEAALCRIPARRWVPIVMPRAATTDLVAGPFRPWVIEQHVLDRRE